ncbi:MAG: cation diffusion facilitator family transporter [Gemmataceae bacterium]
MSLVAAILTIAMKWTAYALTGSAGLLSDALESGVNLLAAFTAGFSYWFASLPADRNHAYGHEKVEYFSIGFEGGLIGIAGLGTIWYAIERLVHPREISALDIGSAIVIAATAVNFFTALYLIRSGRANRSITLVANGKHLMTDVYTSLGIVLGLFFVLITGWYWLDAAIALIVGTNILWTGGRLTFDAVHGLMDHAIPEKEVQQLRSIIRSSLPPGADFHALRTRRSGKRTFVEFHLLLAGKTSVATAHRYSHEVEDAIRSHLPDVHVTIHFEPIEESSSWEPDLADLGESTVPRETDSHAR